MVEFLSTCPTNWGKEPVEALEWLKEKMLPQYPLGVYKDVEAATARQQEVMSHAAGPVTTPRKEGK